MKTKSPFLFLALLMMMGTVQAQTLVSGGIYSNTTWTLANSPYRMTGSVAVFPGVTLTIEPGVVVHVDVIGSSTPSQAYLEVRGTFNAIGSPSLPIKFQSTTDTTSNSKWQGIWVKNTQGGVANISYITVNNAYTPVFYETVINYPRLITHSSFNYCGYGHQSFGEVTLRNCSFSHCYNGVYGNYGGYTIKLENCVFDTNYIGAIALGDVLDVYNCTFTNQIDHGLVGAAGARVLKSSFFNNFIGLSTTGLTSIDSCLFTGNGTAVKDVFATTITYSTFTQNQRAVEVAKETVVTNNDISDNGVGVVLSGFLNASDVQPVIVDNRICNNTSYNVENASDLNYALDSNCFCLPDSASIDAKLFDGYDDFTRGLINFSVYDSTCSNIILTVTKIFIPTGTPGPTPLSMQVYPNPSNGLVMVQVQDATSLFDGQVIDLQGRVLQRFTLQNGQQQLDLGGLAQGIYQVSLQGQDGKRWTQRVVLE